MQDMKKVTGLLLAAAVLASTFAACDGTTGENTITASDWEKLYAESAYHLASKASWSTDTLSTYLTDATADGHSGIPVTAVTESDDATVTLSHYDFSYGSATLTQQDASVYSCVFTGVVMYYATDGADYSAGDATLPSSLPTLETETHTISFTVDFSDASAVSFTDFSASVSGKYRTENLSDFTWDGTTLQGQTTTD